MTKPCCGKRALELNGLTEDRLMKLAHRIAIDAQRKAPAGLGGKYEDLVQFLAEKAIRAAMRYDPYKSGPGYTFTSYLCDVMEQRVSDFYRSKAEGFGDRRYGLDGRVTLAGDTMDDEADPDVDFNKLMKERDLARFYRCANAAEESIADWITRALDDFADITETYYKLPKLAA